MATTTRTAVGTCSSLELLNSPSVPPTGHLRKCECCAANISSDSSPVNLLQIAPLILIATLLTFSSVSHENFTILSTAAREAKADHLRKIRLANLKPGSPVSREMKYCIRRVFSETKRGNCLPPPEAIPRCFC